MLNACFSRIQGESINEAIDFVIGMNDAIGDRAAIVFSASLYSALGFNRTIGESFDLARTALLLEGIPEEHIPELLVRPGVSIDQKLGATRGRSSTRRSSADEKSENRNAQKGPVNIVVNGGTFTKSSIGANTHTNVENHYITRALRVDESDN